MSDDNGNVKMFDKFKRLIHREVILPPPMSSPPTSPLDAAVGILKEWARDDHPSYEALTLYVSECQLQAENLENSHLASQPLMLFHHGRAAAFKELKAHLLSLGESASSTRPPGVI